MSSTRRPKIYIAAPYTKGDVAQNVARAVTTAQILLQHGYVPFVPHLNHFWHFLYPHTHEEWLDYDLQWLASCDAVIRLSGPSVGADEEVALAESCGIPVYTSTTDLCAALPTTAKETP